MFPCIESEFDREKSVQIGHDMDLLSDDKYGQHTSVDEGEQTEKMQPQAAAIQGSCIFCQELIIMVTSFIQRTFRKRIGKLRHAK